MLSPVSQSKNWFSSIMQYTFALQDVRAKAGQQCIIKIEGDSILGVVMRLATYCYLYLRKYGKLIILNIYNYIFIAMMTFTMIVNDIPNYQLICAR